MTMYTRVVAVKNTDDGHQDCLQLAVKKANDGDQDFL